MFHVLPKSSESQIIGAAVHNMKMTGYSPVTPDRFVIGKSPRGDGWTDPITNTVFLSEQSQSLIHHELIHVDQYDRLTPFETDLKNVEKLESEALQISNGLLDKTFLSAAGLDEYPWLGNLDTLFGVVSSEDYINKLASKADSLESKYNNSEDAVKEFQEYLPELNQEVEPNYWRNNGPDYITGLVDAYEKFHELEIPTNQMESEPIAWEILGSQIGNECLDQREINEKLREWQLAYSDSGLYDERKLREHAQNLVYDWIDDINELEDLGRKTSQSLNGYDQLSVTQ